MVPEQQPRPLAQAVLALAVQASASADPALAHAANRAVERLRRPLCVAVVGRVSSGKSTLVNALLGTAVSQTSGRECTKVVYVFRHARFDSAVARSRDGSGDEPVMFEGSRLSPELPLPADRIKCVDVTLTARLLERVVLVDTPGMASTNEETSEITLRMLEDTGDAAAEADALLFCLNSSVKGDEAAAVDRFRASRGGTRLSGATAVALLTKPEGQVPDRREVWKAATKTARTMSAENAELFSAVLPVVGLLAETATTGALRERHARALSALARAWNPDQAEIALKDKRMFVGGPGPVGAGERTELVTLLGLFGIGELLDALRAGVPANAAALTRVALAQSGFDEVQGRLAQLLGDNADVLKAAAALEVLTDRAEAVRDRTVYSRAQELLDRPEMFPLRMQEMARQLARGWVKPPTGLADEAWLAVTAGLPPTAVKTASQRAAAWREWAALTDTAGQHLARTMVRAWQLAATGGRRTR